MNLEGTIQNGVVVFDDNHPLVDGTRVEVIVREPVKAKSPLGEMLLRHAGTAQGLPEDAAAQHDHFCTGRPSDEIRSLPTHSTSLP
jgi:hypothetical protein